MWRRTLTQAPHRVPLRVSQRQKQIQRRLTSEREASLSDTVEKVRAHLKDGTKSWDDLWQNKLTPWDLGMPTPALVNELDKMRDQSEHQNITSLCSLVPGCGGGYDLVALAKHHDELIKKFGLSGIESVVVGVDISPTSLEVAQTYLEQDEYLKGSTSTEVQLRVGDFFDADSWDVMYSNLGASRSTAVSFDLIFDYTFYCALPLSMRDGWGEQMSKLLNPENGRLLTLIYPVMPDAPPDQGPPFPVTFDSYKRVLEPCGLFMESPEPYENTFTIEVRKGREFVAFWSYK